MIRRFLRKHSDVLLGCFLGLIAAFYHSRSGPQICPNSERPVVQLPEPSKFAGSRFPPLPKPKHSSTDDYEPVVLLSNLKIPPEDQRIQAPVRPRYYSSELGIHETLYVAVASTRKTIRTLATALNRTAAQYLPRFSYFVNSVLEAELSSLQNLSMNIIKTSDDKETVDPILMLRYLIENHLDNFDWFFLAPDSTYLRGKDLMEYTKKISVGGLNYVGTSADNKRAAFCNFNAGVLLSQAVMQAISSKLTWCLDDVSPDPTSRIGRCIQRAAELGCNEKFDGKQFSAFELSSINQLEDQEQAGELVQTQEKLRSALTTYSLSSPEHFYRLHLELNKNKIAETESLIEELQDSIVKQSPNTPAKGADLYWPIGVDPPSVPKTRFDVIEWTYFNITHFLRPDDFMVAQKLTGANLKDVEEVMGKAVKTMEEWYADKELKFDRLVNGYRRFDPTRGMEYLLDLQFLSEDKTRQSSVVTKRVRLLKALGRMEQLSLPFVTETTRVHVTVTIFPSDTSRALKFLKKFADHLLEPQDNVFLMLVFLYGPNDPGKGDPADVFGEIKQAAKETEKRFFRALGTRIGWVSIRKPSEVLPSEFGIMDLVARKFTKDSIVFRATTDAVLSSELLNRVRLATISAWQVFFPIPFVQYNPSIIYKTLPHPEDFEVKRSLGHFDRYSTEFAAFYAGDYTAARKNIATVWPLVNNDRDLAKEYPRPNREGLVHDLYTLFLNTDSHVFRAVEPTLKVGFRLLSCDKDDQMDRRESETCQSRLANSLAGKQQLALFLSSVVQQPQTTSTSGASL